MRLPTQISSNDSGPCRPRQATEISRDQIRFLADVGAKPLSTTVSRYQRLHLSRRRGNAIRQSLSAAGIIEAVPIATRSGQVVLCQVTDFGRSICASVAVDPGPRPRESLEHRFWICRAADSFEKKGYEVVREHPIKGNGAVDILATRPGHRIAIEVETGKSDVKANLAKIKKGGFDRIILVATSPAAMMVCQRAAEGAEQGSSPTIELLSWLDVS